MKNQILSLLGAAVFAAGIGPAAAFTGSDLRMEETPMNRLDVPSLQRGARTFVNYCLNCHSAKYMRYNRLTDLGVDISMIEDNLMFATKKVGETMTVAMTAADAKAWFGTPPPDLTVESRVRGPDWLYNYFLAFYRDDAAVTGWNNLVLPNVAMPHVLWQLQGERRPLYEEREEHGHHVQILKGWEQVTPGSLSTTEYDQTIGDLVNYMQWMSEPAQNTRVRVGVGVLLFLLLFTAIAWRLNASFWKDVK